MKMHQSLFFLGAMVVCELMSGPARGDAGVGGMGVNVTAMGGGDPCPTPPMAVNPDPADKATGVPINAGLAWEIPSPRIFASTGSFSVVELRTDPAAQESYIGYVGFLPSLDFAPDGTLWGAGSELCTINQVDGSRTIVCESLHTPAGDSVSLNSFTFHPDGTAYGIEWEFLSDINVFYRIDPATCTATEVWRIPGSQGRVWGIDFSPAGVLYGAFRDLMTFDLFTGKATIVRRNGLPFVNDIDWGCDGFIYAVANETKKLYKIDPSTGSIVAEYGPYTSELWGVASQCGGAATGGLTRLAEKSQVSAAAAPAIEDEELQLAMERERAAGAERDYLKALQQAAPETGHAGGLAAHNGLTALAADTITCDVLLDTVDPPVKSICTNTAASRCDPQGLKPCTTYYWRVVAKKACAGGGTATANGPVWSFTTASSVADLDKDCDVDFDDFSIFASEWLTRIE